MPRITAGALSRVFGVAVDTRPPSTTIAAVAAARGYHGTAPSLKRRLPGVRAVHTNNAATAPTPLGQLDPEWTNTRSPQTSSSAWATHDPEPAAAPRDPDFPHPPPNNSSAPSSNSKRRSSATVNYLARARSEFPPETVDASTPEIYRALNNLRSGKGQPLKIRRFIKYLIEERGERPSAFLYWALALANCDTTTGSAAELAAILKEMKAVGIEPTETFYYTALRVLAVHPDYLTRSTILKIMKERDMDLNPPARWYVALGLLRDGQTEMALDYWDQMRRDGIEIDKWVADIFIRVMVLRGFVDEAVQLFYQRLDMAGGNIHKVPRALWSYLLDECSRDLHYEGTKFIWDEMVRPGALIPSDGIALNVLNTAARHGDTELATAVLELLSARGSRITLSQYEAMVDAYAQAGDLDHAFRALCVMADAGHRVNRRSTRSIAALLRQSPGRVGEAVGFLVELAKERYLPPEALNVLVEVLTRRAWVDGDGRVDEALDVYRRLCDLCESGPDERAFFLLLRAATRAEQAEFLIAEMDRFSIRPTWETLGNVVRCFAHDGSLDVALLYLREIGDPGKRNLEAVVRRCWRDKDPRVWEVVEMMRERKVTLHKEVMDLLDEIPRP